MNVWAKGPISPQAGIKSAAIQIHFSRVSMDLRKRESLSLHCLCHGLHILQSGRETLNRFAATSDLSKLARGLKLDLKNVRSVLLERRSSQWIMEVGDGRGQMARLLGRNVLWKPLRKSAQKISAIQAAPGCETLFACLEPSRPARVGRQGIGRFHSR